MSTATQSHPATSTQAATTPSAPTTTNPTITTGQGQPPAALEKPVCICKVPCHCHTEDKKETTGEVTAEKQWTYQSMVGGQKCTCKFELKCSQNCPCQQKNAKGGAANENPCGCTKDVWKCNCNSEGTTQCTFHIEKCKCCAIVKCGYAFSGQSAGVSSTSGAPLVGGQA